MQDRERAAFALVVDPRLDHAHRWLQLRHGILAPRVLLFYLLVLLLHSVQGFVTPMVSVDMLQRVHAVRAGLPRGELRDHLVRLDQQTGCIVWLV